MEPNKLRAAVERALGALDRKIAAYEALPDDASQQRVDEAADAIREASDDLDIAQDRVDALPGTSVSHKPRITCDGE